MKIRLMVVALVGTLGVLEGSWAQSKPEQQIEYRQAAMVVFARSVAALTPMAKGDVAFNKDLALRHATTIANLSDLPLLAGAFGPGTDKGATHKADPKIWSDADRFKTAYERFVVAARALPAAASEAKTLQVALGDMGKTCKGCHDDFRMK